jgi:hypothetical protein
MIASGYFRLVVPPSELGAGKPQAPAVLVNMALLLVHLKSDSLTTEMNQ